MRMFNNYHTHLVDECPKLYEFLQKTPSLAEKKYNALITDAQAPKSLMGITSLADMPYYVDDTTESGNPGRSALAQKIMARYYQYNLFTPDTEYFQARLLWKLKEIMPTYTAKAKALIEEDLEIGEVFKNGSRTLISRENTGTSTYSGQTSGSNSQVSTGEDSATGSDSQSLNENAMRTSGFERANSDVGTETTVSYESDYPQVQLNSTPASAVWDYNTSGSKLKSDTSNTSNGTEREVTSDGSQSTKSGTTSSESVSSSTSESTSQNQNQSEGTNSSVGEETLNRNYSPFEIALAKERFAKLVYNLDEEIVYAVAGLFSTTWDCRVFADEE